MKRLVKLVLIVSFIVLIFFGGMWFNASINNVPVLFTPITCPSCFNITPTSFPEPLSTISENKLFDLIQRWRFDNNLKPYLKSDFLCSVAQIRVKEQGQVISHSGFDGKRFCGTQECWLAENLIKDIGNENQSLNGWLNSKGHRENLEKLYTHSCLRCLNATCVQIFGYY